MLLKRKVAVDLGFEVAGGRYIFYRVNCVE